MNGNPLEIRAERRVMMTALGWQESTGDWTRGGAYDGIVCSRNVVKWSLKRAAENLGVRWLDTALHSIEIATLENPKRSR